MADEQITIPEALWRRLKQTAMGQQCDPRDLITEGLKMVINVKEKKARYSLLTMAEKKEGGQGIIQKSVHRKK